VLSYFVGTVDEKRAQWQGDGELIGKQGADMASKVLRRDDMEVYMFRLLLEWGRIVDDRRGERGFVP